MLKHVFYAITATFLVGITALILTPHKVYAANATLTFSPQSTAVNTGETITATIFLNTDGVAVNRVLAKINYPSNLLTPQSMDTSNSFVELWYQNNLGSVPGQLILEGGVSGVGVNGSQLEFAKINFITAAEGEAQVSFSTESAVYQQSDGSNILSEFSSATYTVGTTTPTPTTATPTTTPTPTSTAITSTTPTPTTSLPNSGNEQPTVILFLISASLTLAGLLILRRL
ncbi:hypothetical protein KC614_01520 [candidate division WWE3 bacterium]|uniref:Cohesin domain-containing protein n=1 Tax=candidate division WWE3 bacterium TaxID=2053526 RepID=A0A955LJZ1_UNCKA|nr:hypothetical protein [candidate division WWE3 bacterium]